MEKIGTLLSHVPVDTEDTHNSRATHDIHETYDTQDNHETHDTFVCAGFSWLLGGGGGV